MKLLAINNVFPPGYIGGYELGAFELLTSLAARGHKVRVLTSDYLDEAVCSEESPLQIRRTLEWLTVKHDRWPVAHAPEMSTFFHPHNLRRVSSEIRRFKPDLVMLFNIMGLGAVALSQFIDQCRIPFVLYLMDNVFAPIEQQQRLLKNYISVFGELGYKNRPVCVSMSHNLVSEVSRVPGLLGDDIRIVPGWAHASASTRGPNHHCDQTRFVFCSRVAAHKGITILADAVELAVRRGGSKFVVDVYGQGEVQQFIQSVHSRALEPWLRYCGSLEKDAMIQKLTEYDALLLPTWEREPFGFVVSEAAAAGCIPVMTAGIGAAEWFVDGVDCIKIRRDAESLYLAMRRIVEMSPCQRNQMQAAAQRVAGQTLTFDRWAEKVNGICHELADRPRPVARDPLAIEAAFQFLGDLWLHSPD